MLASSLLVNNKYEEFLLLADILNLPKDVLRLHANEIEVTEKQVEKFRQYQYRLNKDEPVSKILNRREFWSDVFFINGDVLDPRPETELLIEIVQSHFDKDDDINVLDFGTGSGCIILSILKEYKNAHGIGIDISDKAIAVAKKNQQILNVKNVDFINVSWNDFKSEIKFDVIVSNPPYIKSGEINGLERNVKEYDPRLALDGGESGFVCYEEIIPLSRQFLKNDGLFVCEVGVGQAQDVVNLLKKYGFYQIEIHKDLAGIDRAISAVFLI